MSQALLHELEPVVAGLLDRHLATAREWFPHELVPWERAAELDPRQPWSPELAPAATEGLRSAVLVNLLTEDNLPYYTKALSDSFGPDEAWGEWMRRWTAEEGRHSIVLRDWAVVSHFLDPVKLERGRMQQVSCGVAPDPWSPLGTMLYVTLQELATRIAHFNTARALSDPAGYQVMKRVAADENLHFLFYRDLSAAALEISPSAMVIDMERAVRGFAMPGTGIEGYGAHTAAIAREGIYSLTIYYEQVLSPTLRFWKLEELVLDDEASHARDRLLRHVERVRRVAARYEEQREGQEPQSAADRVPDVATVPSPA